MKQIKEGKGQESWEGSSEEVTRQQIWTKGGREFLCGYRSRALQEEERSKSSGMGVNLGFLRSTPEAGGVIAEGCAGAEKLRGQRSSKNEGMERGTRGVRTPSRSQERVCSDVQSRGKNVGNTAEKGPARLGTSKQLPLLRPSTVGEQQNAVRSKQHTVSPHDAQTPQL